MGARRCWYWYAVVLAVVVLGGAFGAVELDEDMAELAAAVRAACVDESGVDVRLVEAANAGGDLSASPDDKLKCYIKCTMETAGMLGEDGSVDVEAVLALLPDALRDPLADTLRACATQPGADLCDTAYRTQVCWQTGARQHYFLI